ncbi:SCO4848 family membrane protein [Streptomyces polygonati]|uniref:SCO4848 family membrane protein n=1 Tax=Streptomyces polygonati TaxID=1617087 RepID=A0ABV8HLE2_9ACTN
MKLSRRVSWFLVAFGVWSLIVWTIFAKNLWKDTSGLAFHHGDHSAPTAYFWIHITLAVVSFFLGAAIGTLGLRSVLALRREAAETAGVAPSPVPAPAETAAQRTR